MKTLRYVGLVLGVLTFLLMLRSARSPIQNQYVTLIPITLGGAALFIASMREVYSRGRRRLVAVAWIFAACSAAISAALSIAIGSGAMTPLLLLLSVGEAAGAVRAWQRSRFYRLPLYRNYLDS